MSFFIRNKNQRGAKRNGGPVDLKRPKFDKKRKQDDDDEEISSHSESENDDSRVYTDDDEEEEETAQEKRLRLTKEYLKQIEIQGNTIFNRRHV